MDRAYDKLRTICEQNGGSMEYQKDGYPHGAWVVTVPGFSVPIPATGERSFPDLDRFYVPKVENPQTWDDYKNELIPEAATKFLRHIEQLAKH